MREAPLPGLFLWSWDEANHVDVVRVDSVFGDAGHWDGRVKKTPGLIILSLMKAVLVVRVGAGDKVRTSLVITTDNCYPVIPHPTFFEFSLFLHTDNRNRLSEIQGSKRLHV